MSENLFNKQRLTFVTVLYIYIYICLCIFKTLYFTKYFQLYDSPFGMSNIIYENKLK